MLNLKILLAYSTSNPVTIGTFLIPPLIPQYTTILQNKNSRKTKTNRSHKKSVWKNLIFRNYSEISWMPPTSPISQYDVTMLRYSQHNVILFIAQYYSNKNESKFSNVLKNHFFIQLFLWDRFFFVFLAFLFCRIVVYCGMSGGMRNVSIVTES